MLDRLTEHYGEKYLCIKGCKSLYANEERKGAPASNAIVRLAAYEDTGLAPAEVKLVVAALMGRELAQIVEFNDAPLPHLIELAKVESNNEPLTLDELREMDGEPVWCVSNMSGVEDIDCWALVSVSLERCAGNTAWLEFEDYGVWLAYRRKPSST